MARTAFEQARRWMSSVGLVVFVGVAVFNAPPDRLYLNDLMEYVGYALLIMTVLGRTWAGLYLSGRKSRVLCTEGPFSLSRNPLYFFSLMGAMGLGLLTESFTLFGVIIVAFLVYYHFVITHEERRLQAIFGEAFEEYQRRVPRLFPSLRNYKRLDEVTVQVGPFMHSVIDSSCFLWVFFIFEVAEGFTERFGWPLKTLFRLP